MIQQLVMFGDNQKSLNHWRQRLVLGMKCHWTQNQNSFLFNLGAPVHEYGSAKEKLISTCGGLFLSQLLLYV